MSDLVYQWLDSAGLKEYYPAFEQNGITPQKFVTITIQDYGHLGIQSLPDKQKLFRLITTLKSRENLFDDGPRPPVPQQHGQQHGQQPQQLSQQQPQQQQSQHAQPYACPSPSANDPIVQAHNPAMYDSYGAESLADEQEPPGAAGAAAAGSAEDDLLPRVQLHPQLRPDAPPDKRGLPTASRTVVPPNDLFFSQIQARIRVVIRKRPINQRECEMGQRDILTADGWNQISVHEPKTKVDLTKYTELHTFKFDHVFNEEASNQEIYEYTARPLVRDVFCGISAAIFAYGQTGAGKSYTMMEKQTGIYVLAAYDILQYLADYNAGRSFAQIGGRGGARPARPPGRLVPFVSFFEIYGGKLFDLLNNRKRLLAQEDGKGNIVISGLQERPITSVDNMLHIVDFGLSSRSVGATGANADSSRSHAILQLTLRNSKNGAEFSRISFIDLAGSERAADVQNSDRQTRMEGAEINKSLLALKECIRAMDRATSSANHIPFRGSKLTMVLRDSFIGNSRTVMIANVSPNDRSSENTLNTLRYADRVKELQSGRGGIVKFPVLKLGQNAADVILGLAPDSDDFYRGPTPTRQSGGGAFAAKQAGSRPSSNAVRESMASEGHAGDYDGHDGHDGADGRDGADGGDGADAADELMRTHCDLVDSIYELEDQVMRAHRQQVDTMMQLVKEEVALLHGIENNQISMESWLERLESVLGRKEGAIQRLRHELGEFRSSLQIEEEMSRNANKKRRTPR